MSKRIPFSSVSLFLIAAFMTAGCAKEGVVKKDETIASAPVVEHIAQPTPPQPPSDIPTPPLDDTSTVVQASPQTDLGQGAPSNGKLQSALNKIYFNFDSADLSDSARSTLTKNADALMKEPAAKIRIEGNCDERGSAEYNMALGERRAKAAQQYLVTLGVKPDRLTTISYGKEKPAVQGNDETAWSKNRIADFIIVTP